MKRLFPFLGAIVLSMAISSLIASPSMEEDSVQMGGGYANDIYYSFTEGEVASVDRTNWDIAFYTLTWSAGIMTNDGNGVELRVYPNTDTAGWDAIDTTGLSEWPVLYNSTENWEDGSFNRSATGHPDYGWGKYNTINHNVVGDSIYILTFAEGSPKKLWIEQKISTANIYEFRYANLDGTEEVSEVVDCSGYTDKNFLYYSLHTGEVIDREPVADSWDILFTKYITMLPGNVPYPVTGVLNNESVPANRYDEVGPDFDDWSAEPFDSTKVSIGYDWKYFDMSVFAYVVEDSIAFFISNRQKDVHKLVFSVFDYTIGNIVFSFSMVSTSGVYPEYAQGRVNVFPNPASDYVALQAPAGETIDFVRISDASGKVVFQSAREANTLRVNLPELPAGLYLVHLGTGDNQYIEKLLIRK